MSTWVFTHGSLMAEPPFRVRRSSVATVEGWHRTFGHPSIRNWGTAAAPAPTSALARGGSVTGVAHLVEASVIGQIMARESSDPIEVSTALEHHVVPALTWLMTNRWSSRPVSMLASLARANVRAGGGPLGDAHDYLRCVRDGLASYGAVDQFADCYLTALRCLTD